jgi:Fur family ferric uptake transcriptional regulator
VRQLPKETPKYELDSDEIEKAILKFRQYLREKGLRITPERERICREIYATTIHFDAEELIQRMMATGAPVSRATVYRTLEVLEECGLVKKIRQTDKRHHYEKIYGLEHHDHLFCEGCGKIIEFRVDEIEEMQDDVCRKFGFQPTGHSLQIYGLCRDCIAKKTKERESLPE